MFVARDMELLMPVSLAQQFYRARRERFQDPTRWHRMVEALCGMHHMASVIQAAASTVEVQANTATCSKQDRRAININARTSGAHCAIPSSRYSLRSLQLSYDELKDSFAVQDKILDSKYLDALCTAPINSIIPVA